MTCPSSSSGAVLAPETLPKCTGLRVDPSQVVLAARSPAGGKEEGTPETSAAARSARSCSDRAQQWVQEQGPQRDCAERSPKEVKRHISIPSGALWQMLLLGHMFSVNIVEL